MDAASPSFGVAPPPVVPGAGRAAFGQASVSALSMKWSALHDAAAVVAGLGGLAAEPMAPEVRNFPAAIRDAGGWRRTLAEQGIDDLAAVMEPGLAALLSVHARGADPASAACTLHAEFIAARSALLALVPPASGGGGRRLA